MSVCVRFLISSFVSYNSSHQKEVRCYVFAVASSIAVFHHAVKAAPFSLAKTIQRMITSNQCLAFTSSEWKPPEIQYLAEDEGGI